MTILAQGIPGSASRIAISTWVYIPSESVEAQNKAAETLDDHIASASVHRRIPIMEFGQSIQPRVGVHIGMECRWEGYLGQFWWNGFIYTPDFPDYLCDYWIGGKGMTREGWFPFATGLAIHSESYFEEWTNALFIFAGTDAAGWGTSFYPFLDAGSFPMLPEVHWNNFDSSGIPPFYVGNDGPRGPYFARWTDSFLFGLPLSWTYHGDMKAIAVLQQDRVAVKPDDIATPSLLVNSEIFFAQMYPSPLNFTMQKTPTTGPSPEGTIVVDTGGTGKHFAYGDLVIVFPELPNVTYGKPAIPSSLYYDGNITFLLTALWPEKTTRADGEIVPTLTFRAGGSFKLDSWNHIYFAVDLNTMRLEGGQDNPAKTEWVETFDGMVRIQSALVPPTMTIPPKFAFLVNGQKSSEEPEAALTVYPSFEGHWAETPTFDMALGSFGMPILEQEIDTYKVTGPNQNIMYAYTHVYLGQFIEPTAKNLSKFVWKSKNSKYNHVIPPANKKAAVEEFGTPDIWLYRDKDGGVEFKNLGRTGALSVIGTKPKDFRPGPGQPERKKKD